MKSMRFSLLAAVTFILYGSLAATGGYAWYIRSDWYRRSCAERLSRKLALPSDIGRVVARSRHARQFNDVTVWLPERRDRALYCREALVTNNPTPDGSDAYDIEVTGGTCEISTRTWLRTDYRQLVESGLRPGFSKDGPRKVSFSGLDLAFAREQFKAELKNASGLIWFQNAPALLTQKGLSAAPLPAGLPKLARLSTATQPGADAAQSGYAYILCREINGHATAESLSVEAAFSPEEDGVRLDRVEVTIPHLPLGIMELKGLLGAAIPSGMFEGHLLYSEKDGRRVLRVNGKCADIELAELTAAYFPKPWRGRCPEVELEELRFENDLPAGLRFRGTLTDVVLEDLLAPLGWKDVGGTATLYVSHAEISPAGIDRLIASGKCGPVALEPVTAKLGMGRMSGNLRIVIHDLTIEKNRFASLNAEILVDDDPAKPNWIEGKLLKEAISRTLKIDLPMPILPERVEYNHLGVRLDVRDETLHVFGTGGPREKTLLQVRILGKDFAIKEPSKPYPLGGWCDALRAQGTMYLEARMRALRERSATPSSQPK